MERSHAGHVQWRSPEIATWFVAKLLPTLESGSAMRARVQRAAPAPSGSPRHHAVSASYPRVLAAPQSKSSPQSGQAARPTTRRNAAAWAATILACAMLFLRLLTAGRGPLAEMLVGLGVAALFNPFAMAALWLAATSSRQTGRRTFRACALSLICWWALLSVVLVFTAR
jgi:hypothetical protein